MRATAKYGSIPAATPITAKMIDRTYCFFCSPASAISLAMGELFPDRFMC